MREEESLRRDARPRARADRAKNAQRLRGAARTVLPGDVAFKLYDTYGFPLDLTQDVLRDDGIDVDVAEFERLMEEQRERGRAARKDEAGAPEISSAPVSSSRFVGDHVYEAESEILAAQRDGDGRDRLWSTAETPFYPEGGGQIGDRGVIETDDRCACSKLPIRASPTARSCISVGCCAATSANSSRAGASH